MKNFDLNLDSVVGGNGFTRNRIRVVHKLSLNAILQGLQRLLGLARKFTLKVKIIIS